MEKTDYDKGYERGYAEAMEVVRKTKITPTKEQLIAIYKSDYLRGDIPLGIIKIIIDEWEKIRNKPN